MDQRADGGRALHRVGEPDMERELAGLAYGTAEDQQADRGGGGQPAREHLRGKVAEDVALEDAIAPVVEEKGAGGIIEPDKPEQEAEVADPGRDERLLGCRRCGRPVKPEPDEQIRCQSDQLPADEEQQQAGSWSDW